MKKIHFLALLALVALGVFALWYEPPAQVKTSVEPRLDVRLSHAGLLDYEGRERVAALAIEGMATALENATLEVRALPDSVPSRVLLLEHPRAEATQYPAFARELAQRLSGIGFEVRSASAGEIAALKEPAVILVATGAWPTSLPAPGELVARNHTVLFLGERFELSINADGGVERSPERGAALERGLGIEMRESELALQTSKYVVRVIPGSANATPRLYRGEGFYSLAYRGQGYLVLWPATLDRGWLNAHQAAEAFVRVIRDGAWQESLAVARRSLPEGAFAFFAASPPVEVRRVFGQAILSGRSGNETFERRLAVQLEARDGVVQLPAWGEAGGEVRVSLRVPENFSYSQRVRYALEFWNATERVERLELEPLVAQEVALATVALNTTGLPAGYYVVRVVDAQGGLRAQAFYHARSLEAEVAGFDAAAGLLRFRVLEDGQPLRNARFSLQVGERREQEESTNPAGEFELSLSAGEHALRFGSQGQAFVLRVHVPGGTFLDSPTNQLLLFAALAVFGIGVVITKSAPQRVHIDIPDYPPREHQAVKLKGGQVRQAFNAYNVRRGWPHVPLALGEVQQALKSLLGNSVGSQESLGMLLRNLAGKGVVREALGFWVLGEWERESRASAVRLALGRWAREAAIHAGRTFQLKECCDLEVKGKRGAVHVLYVEAEKVWEVEKRALGLRGKGLPVLLFPSAEERGSYLELLRVTPGRERIVFRLEAEAGSVVVATPEELEGVIRNA